MSTSIPANSPVLAVQDLSVSFQTEAGRVDAVRKVSFNLHQGETIGIVGESGSGKSVTSLAVMGLLPEIAQVGGSIRFDGQELLGKTDAQMSKIRGNGLSMVFQDPLTSLTPVYTIGDQLVEALLIHNPRMGKKRAWQRGIELLSLVGIVEPDRRMKAFPHEFSGGMRQRVVIAIAIANDPKLIICDEPTTALDVTVQAQILNLIRHAQDETGAAVIMITHDLGVVAGLADKVMVMYAGAAVETAPVDELFADPRMPYTIGLLGAVPRVDQEQQRELVAIKGTPPLLIDLPEACSFVDRCPIAIGDCRHGEPALQPVGPATDRAAACLRAPEIERQLIGGAPVYPTAEIPEHALAQAPRHERPAVLEVTNLTKTFPLTAGFFKRKVGEVHAVKGVSFDVRAGETVAIVGESGSGKTTTLLEIMDLAQPPDGKLVVNGTDVGSIASRSQERQTRRDIQIVFQDPMGALDPRMTVFEVIAEPMRAIGMAGGETSARVDELMERVGLDAAHVDRFPQAFSGGQRQRIGIARALSTRPKLLVLDEPVSALDVSIQAGVLNLLNELKADLGISYLLVAHDLSVVRHIADRVAVMRHGEFVEQGDVADVFDRPQHPYTRELLAAIPIPDPQAARNQQPVTPPDQMSEQHAG